MANQCQASLTSATRGRSPIREQRFEMSPGTVITVPVTDALLTHCAQNLHK